MAFSPSDYNRNLTDATSEFMSAPLGSGVVNSMWQLSLALIFKMIITVFTFGIKVSLGIYSGRPLHLSFPSI